ncbi:hypothetical protein [Maribellus mangrovi]|uniref:hypothetical protein n=1 Tax=Maribellus mangrovi TaxID=3133146 RepID=UPI0030ED52D9
MRQIMNIIKNEGIVVGKNEKKARFYCQDSGPIRLIEIDEFGDYICTNIDECPIVMDGITAFAVKQWGKNIAFLFDTYYKIEKQKYLKTEQAKLESLERNLEEEFYKIHIEKEDISVISDLLKTYIEDKEIEELNAIKNNYLKYIQTNSPKQIVVEGRMKKIVDDEINKIVSIWENQSWDYVFYDQADFELFFNMIRTFFQDQPITLPKSPIKLKPNRKSYAITAMGKIHSNIKEDYSESGEYFNIARTLDPYQHCEDKDLKNAMSKYSQYY